MADTKAELTPITVVTGFLGAGKTTLVNYILKEQRTWKIAVLENEFGEVSIDDGLVAESMDAPEDLITMDNGCVCCSVRGDLLRTLGQLATRRKDFDAIILETTGLADPAPIVYTIQTNPKMTDHYRIDSIVCLADAKHLEIVSITKLVCWTIKLLIASNFIYMCLFFCCFLPLSAFR